LKHALFVRLVDAGERSLTDVILVRRALAQIGAHVHLHLSIPLGVEIAHPLPVLEALARRLKGAGWVVRIACVDDLGNAVLLPSQHPGPVVKGGRPREQLGLSCGARTHARDDGDCGNEQGRRDQRAHRELAPAPDLVAPHCPDELGLVSIVQKNVPGGPLSDRETRFRVAVHTYMHSHTKAVHV
jgi:hypothetical protein